MNMKGKYPFLACLMALGAAGTTMWALSQPKGELLESTLLEHRIVPYVHKDPGMTTRANAEGSLYWTVAKSYYKDGSLDKENGVVRQFGTRVEIDGNKATIYGLVDFYFDEVDNEYGVEGIYDDRASTITIEGTQYENDKPVDSFIKLADMYSLSKNEDYTLVLFAGDMYGQQLETVDKLIFKVSDDLSTLTSQTGYGAYAFNSSGNPMAFYDYYQPGVEMTKAKPDSGIAASTENIDFEGLFVATNMPVKQTIYLYNKGSEETTFTITSSSDDLVPSITEGSIAACSSSMLEVTFYPKEVGRFEGSISVESPEFSQPLVVTVDVEVCEQPDYTKITKANSSPIEFGMSPVYPFVITEYDGHIAAKSTNDGKGAPTQSFFICKLNVPNDQTGVFSWDAVQITSQPNTLTVYLDGEPIKYDYYVQTSQPVDMSGIIGLSAGEHEVVFSQEIDMDWSIYGDVSEGYVWNLDFQLMESKENLAYLETETADFGSTFYDGLTIEMNSEVTLLNLGTTALKVTGIKGNGNFSGEVPAISVPQGGEIVVPVLWKASAIGKDSGEVVIETTAGDFSVKCEGIGEALPYDYSKFVTEGKIAFNTSVEWPFKISDNGKYLYNSTSKADIDGITECWLEAIFEVPEGKVGMISWDAINDSEKLFVFMNTPSLISGTRFNIDGVYEEMVGGEGIRCTSSSIFSPDQLTFKSGRHSVRFTYKKTSNNEDYVFGEDRLKLFEIALKLENVEDHKGDIANSEISYPNEVFVGCVGHYPTSVINYTTETPELISSQCDGPFSAKVMGNSNHNLNLMIEFTPSNGGEYENDLILNTNIGDYTIHCVGKAKESQLGTAIFYEGFEYDFENNWVMTDANHDDYTWVKISPYLAEFQYDNLLPYDGNEGLLLRGYDSDTYQYLDTDDYASTPAIAIPSDGKTTLRFMVMSSSYMDQFLDVLVGEGDDVATYEVVKELTFDVPVSWETYEVDLSQFAGKTVHIAFKGYEIAKIVAIDDVLVATTGTPSRVTGLDDNKIVSEEIYSIAGERLAHPHSGVNIVVTRYSDGSQTTEKRILK